jgi:hypothetical protein
VGSPDLLQLVRERGKTPDLIALGYVEGDQPKPEVAFQPMLDRYRDAGFEVLMGGSKRLPAESWGNNREAYRVEAVLTPPAPKEGAATATSGQRIHIDGYVVLFGTKAALTATVYTTREDVDALRSLVEQILQQFRLGKPAATAG